MFAVWDSYIPKRGSYCSKECRTLKRTCAGCGATFRVSGRRTQRYCSHECYCNHAHQKAVKLWNRCQWCGQQCPAKRLYCCLKCRRAREHLVSVVKGRQRRFRAALRRPMSVWQQAAVSEERRLVERAKVRGVKTWAHKCSSAASTNRYRVPGRSQKRVSQTEGCESWTIAATGALRIVRRSLRKSPWANKCQSTVSNQRKRHRRLLQRSDLKN